MSMLPFALTLLPLSTASITAGAPWVSFEDQTAFRLIADNERGMDDDSERDLAIGDVDNDGDMDIVVARKTETSSPCNASALCQNQLLLQEGINEGHPVDGVFVDRTIEYATAADDGGMGFLDITNDRDLVLADVNGDTWLDIVTATAVGDGLPKTLSHPRVYLNLGSDGNQWLGFRYEEHRIPQLFTIGGLAVAPRFTSVSAGDIDNDGDIDLYFTDHDNSITSPPVEPEEDLNDRLLINDGTGVFVDSFEDRMTSQMLLSAFAPNAEIVDMNNDGFPDIVKCTALQTPQRISISYNDPSNPGYFDHFDVVYTQAAYHVGTTDLNNDGRVDLVVTDDGTDAYLLNQGNDANNVANFLTFQFSGDDGFGGNQAFSDLDADGNVDVLITDVHVDFDGCNRRLHIYRNQGDLPNVTLNENGGQQPWTPQGTHDVAVMDINNDGLDDLFISTCEGNQIWINTLAAIEYEFPNNLPEYVLPGEETVITAAVTALGAATLDPDSVRLFVSTDFGPFEEIPMLPLGNQLFEAALPPAGCLERIRYYFSASLSDGTVQTVPSTAPLETLRTDVASQITTLINDSFEGDVSGWTIVNDPTLTSGAWEQADPNQTVVGAALAQPEDDATPGNGTLCYITENGDVGGPAGAADVDGGPTYLISPIIDLEDQDGVIEYAYWFANYNGSPDALTVEISRNDGASWFVVRNHTEPDTIWRKDAFRVTDFIPPSDSIRLRFGIADSPNDSLTEAGIDDLVVSKLECAVSPQAEGVGPRYLSLNTSGLTDPAAINISGFPTAASENETGCIDGYVQADGSLASTPFYQSQNAWGDVVFVKDQLIIPNESYRVQFELEQQDGIQQLGGSIATTYPWADVNQNWVTNFEDILLTVQAFQQNYQAVSREQADVAPCLPNGIVNFEDILAVVQAFQGQSFVDYGCNPPCPQ